MPHRTSTQDTSGVKVPCGLALDVSQHYQDTSRSKSYLLVGQVCYSTLITNTLKWKISLNSPHFHFLHFSSAPLDSALLICPYSILFAPCYLATLGSTRGSKSSHHVLSQRPLILIYMMSFLTKTPQQTIPRLLPLPSPTATIHGSITHVAGTPNLAAVLIVNAANPADKFLTSVAAAASEGNGEMGG